MRCPYLTKTVTVSVPGRPDVVEKEFPHVENMKRPQVIILSPDELGDGALASYHFRTNTIYVRGDVVDDASMKHAVKEVNSKNLSQSNLFACEEDPLSTFAHEMGHWYHAEFARQKYADSIDTKDDLKAIIEMTAEDARNAIMNRYPDFDFGQISRYAELKTDDVPDEMIAESFTRKLLGRDNQESRAVLEVVLGEDW